MANRLWLGKGLRRHRFIAGMIINERQRIWIASRSCHKAVLYSRAEYSCARSGSTLDFNQIRALGDRPLAPVGKRRMGAESPRSVTQGVPFIPPMARAAGHPQRGVGHVSTPRDAGGRGRAQPVEGSPYMLLNLLYYSLYLKLLFNIGALPRRCRPHVTRIGTQGALSSRSAMPWRLNRGLAISAAPRFMHRARKSSGPWECENVRV